MRTLSIILFSVLFMLTFQSCRYSWTIKKNNHKYSLERDFKNQGEQEDYWTRKVFRKDYQKQTYSQYNGEININKSEDEIHVVFDSTSIIIGIKDSVYLDLFTSRLINPEFLGCNSKLGHGILINELCNLETKHKKRFSLWVWQPNNMNPQVVLLEVTNSRSNRNKKLSEFIKGAELTFVYLGWIII